LPDPDIRSRQLSEELQGFDTPTYAQSGGLDHSISQKYPLRSSGLLQSKADQEPSASAD
jgi:hypothetical protein